MRSLTVEELISLLSMVDPNLKLISDGPVYKYPNPIFSRHRSERDSLAIGYTSFLRESPITVATMSRMLRDLIGHEVTGYKVYGPSKNLTDYIEGNKLVIKKTTPVKLCNSFEYNNLLVTGLSYTEEWAILNVMEYMSIESYELINWGFFNESTIGIETLDLILDRVEQYREQGIVGFDTSRISTEHPLGKPIYLNAST